MKKFIEYRLITSDQDMERNYRGTWHEVDRHTAPSRRQLMKRLTNPNSPHFPQRKVVPA